MSRRGAVAVAAAVVVALALVVGLLLRARARSGPVEDAAGAATTAAPTVSSTSVDDVVPDAAGCSPTDGTDRPFRAGAETGPVVGDGPDGGRVCAYDKGKLVGSRRLTERDAVELAGAVRAGSDGIGPEGRACPGGYDYMGGGLEPHFTAHLTYSDEAPTDLWVYGNVCLPSGVVNNVGRFVLIGPDLPALLGRLVRTPAPFPVTDASLPPGPVAQGPMTTAECPDGVHRARSRPGEKARLAQGRLVKPMFDAHPDARWAYAGTWEGVNEQAVVTADGSRVARVVIEAVPGHRWRSVTHVETC